MRRGVRESVAFARRRSGELRPRRRAVDRAAIGKWDIVWQLVSCRKVSGNIGIVGLWKCGIMRLWDYGIGLRRLQFQNSVMVHFHNCTISQSISPAACGYDACCKYTRQFFGFVNEWTKLADLNIFGLPDYLEPNACLRKLFHGNFELMDKILARFGFCCFCIIRSNAGGSTEQLVSKTAAADSLLRQRSAYLNTACSKFYDSILKFVFCHASALLQSHNSTISYFHNYTISQFNPVIRVESVYINNCLFHLLSSKKIGPQTLRSKTLFRVGRTVRLDMNLLTGSVGIVPSIIFVRNRVLTVAFANILLSSPVLCGQKNENALRNNSCGGGCGSLREAMRRGARESVAALQTFEPYAEETVVDDISSVRLVEEVAFFQLCGGGADGGGGWKRVPPDETACGYGFHKTFPADGLQDGLFGRRLASEKVEVEWLGLRHEFIDGVVDSPCGIKPISVHPYAVEDSLDIPRYSIEAVVEMAERLGIEWSPVVAEEPCGEFLVFPGVDGPKRHELGTLVERALGRDEHFVHHVLLGSGEDKVRVWHELDVASQERLDSLFGEFANLLELVDGDGDFAFVRCDVVERVLQGGLRLGWGEIEGEREGSVFLRGHRRAAALEERDHLPSNALRCGVKAAENGGGECLYEGREVLDRKDVEIDRGMVFFKDAKGVVDEAGLSVAARRDERHVPAVGYRGDELPRLVGTIAEVFGASVATYQKRVVEFHARHYTINSTAATKISRRKFRRGMSTRNSEVWKG